MLSALDWSRWQSLDELGDVTPGTLAELLDGGQAFRWNRTGEDIWQGVWGQNVVQVTAGKSKRLQWRAPRAANADAARELARYLRADAQTNCWTDALPWRSDAHLARCLETFPQLRILRQPFAETLLCFLCSATKQIVQIKQMVELLAVKLGKPITDGLHALPEWPVIAKATEAELRSCLLGFRARYIHQTAQFLAAHPAWLAETESLPYHAAKERLCTLPGVGEKVADCVLLFGAGKMEAFPVDVWIIKTMEKRYGLEGWKPSQIAHFGRIHFGPYAGLAQQYLFAYERHAARLAKSSAATQAQMH